MAVDKKMSDFIAATNIGDSDILVLVQSGINKKITWANTKTVIATWMAARDNAFSVAQSITATTNQLVLGTTNTTTINATAPASSAIYTIADVGTAATFVMSAGNLTIGGSKTFSSAVTINPTTNQLVLGVTNTVTLNSIAPAASRVYSINKDIGAAANFVLAKGSTAKWMLFDISSSTDSKTLTLACAHTDDRTITFPDATGTVAVTGQAPSFTNITLTNTTNQIVLGTTNTTTISATAPAASRVYTIPDVLGAADFVLTAGTQNIGGSKTFTSQLNASAASSQIHLGGAATGMIINAPVTAADRVYSLLDLGSAASFCPISHGGDTSKRIYFDSSGMTSNRSLIISCSNTVSRTLTIPVMSANNEMILATTDTSAYKLLVSPIAIPNRYTESTGVVTNSWTILNAYNGNVFSNKILLTKDRCNPDTEKFMVNLISRANTTVNHVDSACSGDGRIIILCPSTGTTLPYISYDYGKTFTIISGPTVTANSAFRQAAMSSDGSVVYVFDNNITDGLIWVSRNYGITWSSTTLPIAATYGYMGSACSSRGDIVYTHKNGGDPNGETYRSIDYGTTWIAPGGAGLYTYSLPYRLRCSASGKYVAMSRPTTTYGYSNDYAVTMTISGTGGIDYIFSADGSTVLKLNSTIANSQLSTDYGVNYTTLSSLTGTPVLAAMSSNGSKIVITTTSGVIVSGDRGATWTTLAAGTAYSGVCMNGDGSIIVLTRTSGNTTDIWYHEPWRYTQLGIAATTNQLVLGTTNTITVNAIAPASSTTVSLQDAGTPSNIVQAYGTTAKTVKFDISASTDAKALTLESKHTDNRTITFPNSTGTLFLNGGSLDNGTTATTQAPNDNSTKVATTAYVDDAVGSENVWDRSSATGLITQHVLTDTITLNNAPLHGHNENIYAAGYNIGSDFIYPDAELLMNYVYGNLLNTNAYLENVAVSASGQHAVFVKGTGPVNQKPFITHDFGKTITEVSAFSALKYQDAAISDDGQTIVITDTTATTGRVKISTNGGTSWTDYDPATTTSGYAGCCMSGDGRKIYVSDNNVAGYMWYSADAGANWSALGTNVGAAYMKCSSSGKHLIVLNSSTYRISNDFGATWASNAITAGDYHVGISRDGSVMVVTNLTSTSSVISTDYGANFAAIGTLPADQALKCAISGNGNIILIGGLLGLYYSYDKGTTWTTWTDTLPSHLLMGMSSNGDVIYTSDTAGTPSNTNVIRSYRHVHMHRTGTHTTDWNGPTSASAVAGNINYNQVGNTVTLWIPSIMDTSVGAGNDTGENVTVLPTYLRPPATINQPITAVKLNNSATWGVCQIDSSGNIDIIPQGTVFALNGTTEGWPSFCVTYIVQT